MADNCDKGLVLKTARELNDLFNQGKVDKEEVFRASVSRIRELDSRINAFVNVLDRPPLSNASGRLAAVTIGIKDNISTKGIETTCSSNILKGFIPAYDATVIEKLKAEGALIVGKTNLDEFAFGSSTENSCFGPTSNPWDNSRVSGGSSGGSAAAVSSGMVTVALGSDTGGSIRQPASFCGVVGLKPTYGLVSRYGLIAFGSSLDQIGPFARNVYDCALVLSVIAGYDEKDSTSVNRPAVDFTKALNKDIKGLKIGIAQEYFNVEGGVDKEVEKAVFEAKEVFCQLGAQVVDISLPTTKYAVSVYYIVATAEASSNLARFDGVEFGHRSKECKSTVEMYMKTRREGFGSEAKRRIMLGTFVLSSGYYEAYYNRALKVRTLIRNDFQNAFKDCDIILSATAATTAFKKGEKTEDPLKMYLSDIFTISANLAGLPALSVNCGFDGNGLPIGLQLIGRPFEEEALLNAAYIYEQNTKWHTRTPLKA